MKFRKLSWSQKKIESTATPSNAHPPREHVSARSDEGESLDLFKCEVVHYETGDRAPGLRFRVLDGKEGWTCTCLCERGQEHAEHQESYCMPRRDNDSGSDSSSDSDYEAVTARKTTYRNQVFRIQRSNTMSSVP